MDQQLLMAAETDSAVMVRCVEACERCHRTCLRTAMTYCLEQAADRVDAALFRSLLTCSDMCRATIDALLSGYESSEDVCALCARVCTQCADSCERHAELQDCVEVCRACSLACIAVTGGSRPS